MRGQDVIGQALGSEIALLLGHPLVQPSVRMNDECGHASILLGRAGSSRCLGRRPPVKDHIQADKCHGYLSATAINRRAMAYVPVLS